MNILAIDPGNTHSAYVLYETSRPTIHGFGLKTNGELLEMVKYPMMFGPPYMHPDETVIEMVACYGMAVGAEVFETCYWIGRFAQQWDDETTLHRMFRREVKMHLCGCNNAKDANVRQSLIDRFGPGKDKAIGKKASQGPLYGVSGDVWSALAVAVTFADTKLARVA
jgi:hypothetical protein